MSKLKASEEFVKGKHSIGYVDTDFKNAFNEMEFEVSKTPTYQTLTKRMSDAEIESELKPGICTLGDVMAFLENPPEGSKDGYYNIFYFSSFVVDVYWRADSGEWLVGTWRRGDRRWGAGVRVFSPATELSVPMSSDTETLGTSDKNENTVINFQLELSSQTYRHVAGISDLSEKLKKAAEKELYRLINEAVG